ncbi:MAG: hypothetical protein ACT6RL_12020 [Neoaquamicrobium sediminum]|uniref:hypothetical protein n=1 Tax=Neoaquamicrobium sediminum TaxID=1849104 RepID=UPI001D3174A5|nr:hypothetical protein [Mesorhizobium sp.]
MRIILVLTAVALGSTACQNSVAVQQEAEVFNSIQYDTIPCADLQGRRNALAAQHGVSPDIERTPPKESTTPGFGIVLPDGRSDAERARARAIGEITAMNRSMQRRACGKG